MMPPIRLIEATEENIFFDFYRSKYRFNWQILFTIPVLSAKVKNFILFFMLASFSS